MTTYKCPFLHLPTRDLGDHDECPNPCHGTPCCLTCCEVCQETCAVDGVTNDRTDARRLPAEVDRGKR